MPARQPNLVKLAMPDALAQGGDAGLGRCSGTTGNRAGRPEAGRTQLARPAC
jgi:hypothetical protein